MSAKRTAQRVVIDCDGNELKVRSLLEVQFANLLNDFQVQYGYEISNVNYIVPASEHTYKVDFTIRNGIYYEVKGYLEDHAERMKYRLIKEQHPEIDIRFVFANPQKLCGGTKMTHAAWAEKFGFPYCGIKDVETIRAWCKEKPSKRKQK